VASRVRKAVFPAAGLGTRFLPATKAQPKEMLPLVDKPIIQYGVEEAVASGIDTIILVTGRGKYAIEDHFDVNIELETFLEARGKQALAEEIRKISDLINFAYVRQGEPLGHGVHRITDLVEKPAREEAPSDLAIIGRYVLTPDIFEVLAETGTDRTGEIQLTNGLRQLLARRPLYAVEVAGVRHDTGNKLGFLKAVVYFALKRPDLAGPFAEYLRGVELPDPVTRSR
jgi:UTP-glucose-1-phosphate uridylyltransferase